MAKKMLPNVIIESIICYLDNDPENNLQKMVLWVKITVNNK